MRRFMFGSMLMLSFTVPALSHDHATGVVKERMDMMDTIGKHMSAIRERIKNKRDFTAIKGDAEAIVSHATHIPHLFPPGSTQKPTQARSTIWRNWPDFERLAATLETESKKLASIAVSDQRGMEAQSRAVWDTCLSCHEKYRVRRR